MNVTPVDATKLLSGTNPVRTPAIGSADANSFMDAIEQSLVGANAQQSQADKAVHDLALGRSDNLHDVMIAVAKADLSFRAVLEVRNKMVEAYQEVMRMQV